MAHLVAAARSPVRADAGAEVVLAADLRIGDGIPESFRARADVDLEHLLHRALQSLLDVAEGRGPRLRVLAHPPVVDEPDRDGVQVVELLATLLPGHDQARLLEQLQVLHHAEARHREAVGQRARRLPVLTEQLVEQGAPGRIGQSAEHVVHGRNNM